ncbi:hypothetical protein [Terribacillus sp. FSL K6-0262]|uniref:hypothetical protein n=1 Tax=Terribacillus TaxID=459532 RepID=UPI0030EE4121
MLPYTVAIVISKAHKAGADSLFVRDTDVAGGEGSGFQIYAGIHVPEEAPVFDKQATNAFHGHFNIDNFSVVRSAAEDIFDPVHDTFR